MSVSQPMIPRFHSQRFGIRGIPQILIIQRAIPPKLAYMYTKKNPRHSTVIGKTFHDSNPNQECVY